MTPEEGQLMKAHGGYLQDLLEANKVIAHGPVAEPGGGGFGLSLFDVADEAELERLTAQDPMILADVGARYETYPMLNLRYRA